MKHAQAKLLLLALRLLQVLGAPSTSPPGAPSNLAPPIAQVKAEWTPCPASISTLLQCTNITVPLNYSDPHSSIIELTLAKSPSKQPSMRQGTLVFQNGGPGHETTSTIISYAQLNDSRTDNLNNWFDMVVAEPRGINYNHPVVCDEKYAFARAPLYPTTEDEWNNATDFFGEWGRDCFEKTGEVMKHMDTWTQARDLEAVRLAIGEGGLNYYGVSWGTIRGSRYASLYPQNVRSMVLDGVADHTLDQIQFAMSEASTYSVTQRRMLDWMSKNDTSPLFGRDAVQIYTDLVVNANKSPIPAPACNVSTGCFAEITGDDMRNLGFGPVNSPLTPANTNWASTAQAFKEAYDNNNASLASIQLAIGVQTEPGLMQSMYSIICNDWNFTESWAQYRYKQWMAAANSLDPGSSSGFRMWEVGCQKWPLPGTDPSPDWRVENPSAQILLVNSLWDPATGFDMALHMQSRIDKSVLVARYGEGHGSFGFDSARNLMIEYFKTAQPPDQDNLLLDAPISPDTGDFEIMGWNSNRS